MVGSGKDNGWAYGPYGEILPPPLVAGLNPDDVLREMVGAEIFDLMPPGERKMFYGEAAIYAHQKQLEQTFAGDTGGDKDKEGLYRAILAGKSLSLRPLGYERQTYSNFAPVWRRVGDSRWQVGVEGQGEVEVFEAESVKSAYLKARDLYVVWAEAATAGVPGKVRG